MSILMSYIRFTKNDLVNIVLFLVMSNMSFAQSYSNICGTQYLAEVLGKDIFKTQNKSVYSVSTSYENIVIIPVVFHIILNQTQFTLLGKEPGIIQLIDSQLLRTNQDFNTENVDSSLIPLIFKPFTGNSKIKYALAHATPEGKQTNGLEILITNFDGIEFIGSEGSGIAFSDAKYNKGLKAWDPTTYLNIWVVNPMENNRPSVFLGLTLSPNTINYYHLPQNELGIVLNYKIWNSSTSMNWRILTHELGHYFELKHIWGDDDGKCIDNGGEDDGIDDTPPQANASTGCPTFPVYDSCNKTAGGIMFMNYMDYTAGECQYMFTKGQVAKMRNALLPGNPSYSLTQHPEVFQTNTMDDLVIDVYPNPAMDYINIRFNRTSINLKAIEMYSVIGSVVYNKNVNIQQGFYHINTSNLPKGVYTLLLKFTDRTDVRKVLIQ